MQKVKAKKGDLVAYCHKPGGYYYLSVVTKVSKEGQVLKAKHPISNADENLSTVDVWVAQASRFADIEAVTADMLREYPQVFLSTKEIVEYLTPFLK